MKILLTILFTISNVLAVETYTLTKGSSPSDKRFDYNNKLIKLSLEKTKKDFGDYKIEYTDLMNNARAKKHLSDVKIKNFIHK